MKKIIFLLLHNTSLSSNLLTSHFIVHHWLPHISLSHIRSIFRSTTFSTVNFFSSHSILIHDFILSQQFCFLQTSFYYTRYHSIDLFIRQNPNIIGSSSISENHLIKYDFIIPENIIEEGLITAVIIDSEITIDLDSEVQKMVYLASRTSKPASQSFRILKNTRSTKRKAKKPLDESTRHEDLQAVIISKSLLLTRLGTSFKRRGWQMSGGSSWFHLG